MWFPHFEISGKIFLSQKSIGLGTHFGSAGRGQFDVNWMLVQNMFGSMPCQCCHIDVVRVKLKINPIYHTTVGSVLLRMHNRIFAMVRCMHFIKVIRSIGK